jgi:hypothetical protein
MVPDGGSGMVEVVNTGFRVADDADGPSDTLEFNGVDLEGATKATLAVDAWYCVPCVSAADVAKFTLRYRLNGKPWIDRPLNAQEVVDLTTGNGRGAVGHLLDVPLDDLVSGKNTLEFVTVDVPQNYPPGVANADLILQLK